MVNNVNQAGIQLTGAGFRPRQNGKYNPGEYRRLTNVEIAEDRLRNRRSIHSVGGDAAGSVVTPMTNTLGFLGSMNTYALICNSTVQQAVGPDGVYTLWAPTSLSVPAAPNSFNRLIGFFRYNNKNYWLTLKFDAGTNIKITLLSGNIVDGNDVPSSYDAAYFASLTATDLLTFTSASLDYNKFAFRNFFLQGDRLWLVTTAGVYFSKATDPTIFASPDGGFFKFPDQNITYSMAVRNNIYVLCDNSVNHITYNSDPNLDPVVKRLSDNLGGESGVIHQDTPYIVNNIGVYRIVNGYLDKVLDNELDLGLDYYANTIKSFGEYLILQKYSPVNYEKFESENSQTRTNLVVNPSLETNATGWAGNTVYATRAREVAAGYVGNARLKTTKVNDLTSPNRFNYIQNPGFEVNTVSWTDNSSNTVLSRIDESGNWRGEVEFTASGKIGTILDAVHTPNCDFAVSGIQYNFIVTSRILTSTTSQWNEFELTIDWYNASNVLVGSDGQVWNNIDGNYVAHKLTATAPSDASYAKVSIQLRCYTSSSHSTIVQGATGSAFRFDNIFFGEVRTTTNAPENFTGDTADIGTQYTYDWSGSVGNSYSVEYGVAGNSTQIAEFNNGATGTLVSPNIAYTIGAAFYATAVRRIACKILTYNNVGTLIATSFVNGGSAIDTVANQWKFMTYGYTAPVGAHHITVVFYLDTGSLMAYNEVILVDGLIVEKTETYTGYFDGDSTDTTASTFAWTGAAHATTSTGTVSAIPRRLYQSGHEFTPNQEGNTLGYNVYAFNTDNGALHVIDFTDCRDTPANRGYVVDVLVNYFKDRSGNYNCFFLTNKLVSELSSSYTYSANTYYMNTAYDLDFFDYAIADTDVTKKYAPKIEVEVENFIPPYAVNKFFTDQNQYTTKKFRNLEFFGKVPLTDVQLQVAYDNEEYLPTVDLTVGDETLRRPHFPFRVSLMQRARTISVFLKNSASDTPLTDDASYGQLEISDMQVLWMHTARRQDRRAIIK